MAASSLSNGRRCTGGTPWSVRKCLRLLGEMPFAELMAGGGTRRGHPLPHPRRRIGHDQRRVPTAGQGRVLGAQAEPESHEQFAHSDPPAATLPPVDLQAHDDGLPMKPPATADPGAIHHEHLQRPPGG